MRRGLSHGNIALLYLLAGVVIFGPRVVALGHPSAVAPASAQTGLTLVTTAPKPDAVRYANPYASVQQFMEGIYAADHAVSAAKDGEPIRAVIVPHHLTATVTVATGIRSLVGQQFRNIVLLTPDHFHRCSTNLCTVDATFVTAFGEVHADADTVRMLLSSQSVTEDRELFESEHGVFAVLPYIAHYFPGVTVTPVALSQKHPWQQAGDALLDVLSKAVGSDTVLIVSSDFSHYLPLAQAEAMDALTIKALGDGNVSAIKALKNPSQSDCPGCLWLLASLAESRDFYRPEVLMHTNSAVILGDERLPETTSHFSVIWREQARPR